MKSVIVVVLLLGLAAGQYVQNEPAIQVVQVKAAITKVDDDVQLVVEQEKKAQTNAEAETHEVAKAENPFARPAQIKNTKPPMTFEQILRDGEANPDFQQDGPKFKREKHQKKHPRSKDQKPARASADQPQEDEDMGFDTGLILPVLIGLATVICLVKICTKKRSKCIKRVRSNPNYRDNMKPIPQQNNSSNIQLETIQPIDQSIQFHQSEIRRLKNAYQHLHPQSYQIQ